MKTLFNFTLLITVGLFVMTGLAFSQDGTSKARPIPIGQSNPAGDKLPKPIRFPDPDFPDGVTSHDLTGGARLSIKVDKEGKVSVIDSFGPNAPCSDLDSSKTKAIRTAVIEAAEQAVFEVPMKDGKPTEMTLSIKLTLKVKNTPNESADGDAKPKLVQGGVINGRALRLPKPEYPIGARSARAAGAVQVQVLIGEDGKVVSASAVSGDYLLRDASVRTACKALFSPTSLAGQPVKVSGIITYNYVP